MTPPVEEAGRQLAQLGEQELRRWDGLSKSEKLTTLGVTALIVGGALAGTLSTPDSRQFLMEAINDKNIPVPKIPGLTVQPQFSGPEQEGVPSIAVHLRFDLSTYVPALR
jgi:hypothetical protein